MLECYCWNATLAGREFACGLLALFSGFQMNFLMKLGNICFLNNRSTAVRLAWMGLVVVPMCFVLAIFLAETFAILNGSQSTYFERIAKMRASARVCPTCGQIYHVKESPNEEK